MRTFASQGLTPQIVISYPISSHLHHICASSYLRFLSQISTSSLSSLGLHILRPHLVFTRSDLHRRVTLSLSYHFQDFIMQLLSQLYNLIYLRLQNFISPRSRANRRLVFRKGDGRCYMDNCGSSRAPKLDFAEGFFLDTEPTQVPPGHVVIHDNLTNHVALPTMRHSSF